MAPIEFVSVDVEPGPAHEDGISLRFKRAGASRAVRTVPYESEAGLEGMWDVVAAVDPDGAETFEATATLVDDSSDGVAWLISGGRHGLVLTHRETGTVERIPYLALSQRAAIT